MCVDKSVMNSGILADDSMTIAIIQAIIVLRSNAYEHFAKMNVQRDCNFNERKDGARIHCPQCGSNLIRVRKGHHPRDECADEEGKFFHRANSRFSTFGELLFNGFSTSLDVHVVVYVVVYRVPKVKCSFFFLHEFT